jgi:aromatic-L-amino-acid decarboxylase
MADYLEGGVEAFPPLSQVSPRDIYDQVPAQAPEEGESFDAIRRDFMEKILPGVTHWQHPSFFAYFPANNSAPSVLAEMLMATLGAQCMIWQTSPAAAELEERMMEWLGQLLGLPAAWAGVIQDTASTATLAALLCARERHTQFKSNAEGLQNAPRLIVYCSAETHSSIEKAVKIAGLGAENLRKIPCDENFALRTEALQAQIQADRAAGFSPCAVVATTGTTSSTALDPLRPIGEICQAENLWFHVDAAFAGTAAILPEKRHILDGVELADSFVFNPHKWLFTNFDCTAYFVKEKEWLIRTFEILPEYLKTKHDEAQVNNYRDWGIPLGRRFRALKLWFVLRAYGVKGIQEKLRHHIQLAEWLKQEVENHPDFEVMAPMPLNLLCLRYHPEGENDLEVLNQLNQKLLEEVNTRGEAFLTHTKLNGAYVLRVCIGQTEVQQRHVEALWEELKALSTEM